MSEYTNLKQLSIKEAIENINTKYFLPIFQRDYVWGDNWRDKGSKIRLLFDSIMQGYPIGTILLWEVPKEKVKDYVFYTFIKRMDRHWKKYGESVKDKEEITAVLDGQQRLTSLCIGFHGVYNYKNIGGHWGYEKSHPERKLYLNLFYEVDEAETSKFEYQFEFRKKDDKTGGEGDYWFRVGEICEFNNEEDIEKYIESKDVLSNSNRKDKAKETLKKLYNAYNNKDHYEISALVRKDEDADTILKIFERANTAGQSLNLPDLLLAYLSAYWQSQESLKAEDTPKSRIDIVVKNINRHFGEDNNHKRFNFDRNFVLKACLVLADCENIGFSLQSINDKNVEAIRERWDDIIKALGRSIDLLAEFGFGYRKLTTKLPVLPIAYYFMKIDKDAKDLSDSDKNAIKRYLYLALFKRLFHHGNTDTTLKRLKEIIDQDTSNGFPLETIKAEKEKFNLSVDAGYIKRLLENVKYSERAHDDMPNCTQVLYLISPDEELYKMEELAVDHIFPQNKISSDEKISEYCHLLANLQLLTKSANSSKIDKAAQDWYADLSDEKKKYLEEESFFPSDAATSIKEDPRLFFETRNGKLKHELKKLLLSSIS